MHISAEAEKKAKAEAEKQQAASSQAQTAVRNLFLELCVSGNIIKETRICCFSLKV